MIHFILNVLFYFWNNIQNLDLEFSLLLGLGLEFTNLLRFKKRMKPPTQDKKIVQPLKQIERI